MAGLVILYIFNISQAILAVDKAVAITQHDARRFFVLLSQSCLIA